MARGRNWRGAYEWAVQAREATHAPARGNRVDPDEARGASRVDFSDEKRDDALSILNLLDAHDSTGYLFRHVEGLRWEEIPPRYQGQVATDIREYSMELRRNALLPCPSCGGELIREGTAIEGHVRCFVGCGWPGMAWRKEGEQPAPQLAFA